MAFKGEASSDYVVGQVWGRLGANIYLLDQVRGQWDIQRTIDQLLALTAKWPSALSKLVEDRANGPAIVGLYRTRCPASWRSARPTQRRHASARWRRPSRPVTSGCPIPSSRGSE